MKRWNCWVAVVLATGCGVGVLSPEHLGRLSAALRDTLVTAATAATSPESGDFDGDGAQDVWQATGDPVRRPDDAAHDHTRRAWSCTPPYETPTYAEWVAARGAIDDAVVLEALVEAAGYEASNTWVDVAAGNFCGGVEKEIVLVQNAAPNFSILRGPAPFVVGTGNIFGQPSTHPWRAVAAGDLDNDGYDEIIAVRKINAAGAADLVVGKVNATSCNVNTVLATLVIGTPTNSDWTDVTVGNFRGLGNEIALVKNTPAYFWFVRFTAPGTLHVYQTASLGSRPAYPWQALAAGNIDGAGHNELIAVRKVTDGASSTIRAYQWDPSLATFSLLATSDPTFANTGNHNWISAAVGDFGGSAREAIALVKDKHSHFVVLDYPAGETSLQVLWATDLDTQPGQHWRGLAATDWLGNDHGHDELIAVRNPTGNYRTDLFVYGAPFHRVGRDTALVGTKALFAGNEAPGGGFRSPQEIKKLLRETHANTYNIVVRSSAEYLSLVQFLEATKDFCVDGRQLHVWVTLIQPSARLEVNRPGYRPAIAPRPDFCSAPADSPLTPWNELDYFTAVLPWPGVNWPYLGPPENVNPDCWDYIGWASLIGRLARQYPHLVAVGIDDFSRTFQLDLAPSHPSFTPNYVAEFTSRMRYQQTWLNLVPTFYYEDSDGENVIELWPDVPLTLDSILFYFRSDRAEPEAGMCTPCGTGCNSCTAGTCGELTLPNFTNRSDTGEADMMATLLPAGRKQQVGVYFQGLSHCGTPSVRYGHDLLELALSHPSVDGTTVYTATPLWPPGGGISCPTPLTHKYCAVQSVYGSSRSLAPTSQK